MTFHTRQSFNTRRSFLSEVVGAEPALEAIKSVQAALAKRDAARTFTANTASKAIQGRRELRFTSLDEVVVDAEILSFAVVE